MHDREGNIQNRLAENTGAVERLEERLANLEEKLGPVLGPDYDADAEGGGPTTTSEQSSVADEIMRRTGRIFAAAERVTLLTERIEL